MFLDLMTKPCSVVISRINSDMKAPVAHHNEPAARKKWVIHNLDSTDTASRLKKTLKLVSDVTVPEHFKNNRKISALTLYTRVEGELVKEVICKRFKKRLTRNRGALRSRVKSNNSAFQREPSDLRNNVEVGKVMDRMLHQVALEVMDDAEVKKLVRVFCREHDFKYSDFEDGASLLTPKNVVNMESASYGVSKPNTGSRKRPKKSVATRKVKAAPQKTGIIYVSDDEGEVLTINESMKTDEKKVSSTPPPLPCSEEKEMRESLQLVVNKGDSETINDQNLLSETTHEHNQTEVDPSKETPSEESILRTLLLDTSEVPEAGKSPVHNMPVISEVVSLKECDSPEIVEVKVKPPERRKTKAEVVHNLRMEIEALERLAEEKERERRLLLYFKSCKEELLNRLTARPFPSTPPPPCKSDIFSSVKRMSESSFQPYPETRFVPLNKTNSYKSLTLTSAGQWSMPSSQYKATPTTLWPQQPPVVSPLTNGKEMSAWRRIGQFSLFRENAAPSTFPQCVVCKVVQAAFLCSGCGKEWYCSEQCQKQNWKHHSKMCS